MHCRAPSHVYLCKQKKSQASGGSEGPVTVTGAGSTVTTVLASESQSDCLILQIAGASMDGIFCEPSLRALAGVDAKKG